ncbi:DUF5719 family protein [Microbacterium sp.]|uniref:DUF5719 family protein n=1 Tax=Microbacterium sp. TaxID=51671 RepID=UPI001ACE51A5|nr:DUF5719 family protein [Microbacterium sp.]MBN9192795.1 large extracellular alpha-helical protein [Microbacterium sp.]
MSDNRAFRIAGTGARLLGGAVVAVVAVAATVAGVAFGWPGHAPSPVSVTVAPAPAATVLTCAGPLLALGRDSAAASQLSVAADADVTVGVAPGGPAPREDAVTTTGVDASPGATRLTAAPKGRSRADIAGATSATVAAEDLRGFAASACAPGLTESWLVGGATTTGSADLVLLANPGTVAATVDLTVYGAQGRQVPPGGSGIVVPAGTQRVVPLAGLVLGEEAPVVRVTASGAPVQAALQSSITRTLVTGGVDQEGAIVGSARSQVVPGVRVTVAPGGNEPTTVARLLAPAASTTATLTVTDAGGKEVMTRQVPLTAGAPAEVELDALPRGVYSVTATAGAPLVAAVWQATGSGAGSDFAWFTAAPALSAATLVAVPSGPSPQIAVANTGADAATVTLEPVDGGSSRRILVDPGETVTASVTAGATYRLDPGKTPVTASVSFAAQGALAAFSIWPALGTSAPIRVYP